MIQGGILDVKSEE
ncbi:hypothetical protein CFP56_002886 [Quercus suber]|uniref:Uncharacterized protein n=1 Tax=Quercus suber TaxID=58331 RepID=A0AAW0LF04_QUESU